MAVFKSVAAAALSAWASEKHVEELIGPKAQAARSKAERDAHCCVRSQLMKPKRNWPRDVAGASGSRESIDARRRRRPRQRLLAESPGCFEPQDD